MPQLASPHIGQPSEIKMPTVLGYKSPIQDFARSQRHHLSAGKRHLIGKLQGSRRNVTVLVL